MNDNSLGGETFWNGVTLIGEGFNLEMHLKVFNPQRNKQPVIRAVPITELTVVYWYNFWALHLRAGRGIFCAVFVTQSHENELDNAAEIVVGTVSKLILDLIFGK